MRKTTAGSTAVSSDTQGPSTEAATTISAETSASVTSRSGEKPEEAAEAALEPSRVKDDRYVSDSETGEKGAKTKRTVGAKATATDPDESATDAGVKNPKRKADNEMSESAEDLPAKRARLETEENPAADLPDGAPAARKGTGEEDQTSSVTAEADAVSAEADSSSDEETVKVADRPPAQYVLKCHMCVRVQGSDLAVELTWLSGEDIQLMHQLMQVLKNRLATRKPT